MGCQMIYKFATLDPRPGADNSAVLGYQTLGIEVTIPALAEKCGLGNLDPQHSGTSSHTAAIMAALDAALPPPGSTLVTIRPDLDSVGAMAVLELRAIGWSCLDDRMYSPISIIAEVDAFAHGPWPGPRYIPRTMAEWADVAATATSHPYLAPAAALVSDRGIALADRVSVMINIISRVKDERLNPYAERVRTQKEDLLASFWNGTTSIKADGSLTKVVSTHMGALDLGYHINPVVVATNPKMRGENGEYVKHTVCQWKTGYVDMRGAVTALNAAEVECGGTPGWGGSGTIIGSPQGLSSVLSNDDVAGIVSNFTT